MWTKQDNELDQFVQNRGLILLTDFAAELARKAIKKRNIPFCNEAQTGTPVKQRIP
jgi:hypothetical protein